MAPPDEKKEATPDADRIKSLEAQVAKLLKATGQPAEPAIPRPVRHQREEDARVLASLKRLGVVK